MSSCRLDNWSKKCEDLLNKQINLEYWAGYQYDYIWNYFNKSEVALKNIEKFFYKSAEEERHHAHEFIKYQNLRGGNVLLEDIKNVSIDFLNENKLSNISNNPNPNTNLNPNLNNSNIETSSLYLDNLFNSINSGEKKINNKNKKSDVLLCFEKALEMEQIVYKSLLNLHKLADSEGDPQFTDYIEGNFLNEQIEAINELTRYISQLKRIGNSGHGVWDFDKNFNISEE